MTPEYERYPFVERDPNLGIVSLAPFLPIELTGTKTVGSLALLDTGAAVNVLPYGIGDELGAVWDRKGMSLPLVGNLAGIETRSLVLSARVGNFPVVRLAFAWAKTDAIPILLGQVNFFMEFDVCFHRSRSSFEVRPKQISSSTTPD